jgi:predicted HicB family RNase H-like nuclease
MTMKTMIHKGYHGSIEINNSDYSLYGKILFLSEEITYQGASFAELEERFRQAVDSHRASCQARGEEPPFRE